LKFCEKFYKNFWRRILAWDWIQSPFWKVFYGGKPAHRTFRKIQTWIA